LNLEQIQSEIGLNYMRFFYGTCEVLESGGGPAATATQPSICAGGHWYKITFKAGWR
jgi:hypothetical protein